MKKHLLFVLTIGAALGSSAQQAVTGFTPAAPPQNFSGNSTANVADTITDYLDRATGFYTLTNSSGGYILGTSGATSKTGCHYSSPGTSQVTELMVYFGHKTVVGNPDNISAGVYLVGPDSMPTTLVSSGSVNINNVDVSGFPTFIPMTNYLAQTGDFFVTIEYGSIDDTISIMSTNPTTGSNGPDGAGQKRVRQEVSSLNWQRAWDLWTVNSAPYDADALILPVVSIASGAEDFEMNGFRLKAAYPSPATDLVNIPFATEKMQEVKLTIFSASGHTVFEKNYGEMLGENNIQIDASGFTAGTYFYVLRGAEGQVASKFSVQ